MPLNVLRQNVQLVDTTRRRRATPPPVAYVGVGTLISAQMAALRVIHRSCAFNTASALPTPSFGAWSMKTMVTPLNVPSYPSVALHTAARSVRCAIPVRTPLQLARAGRLPIIPTHYGFPKFRGVGVHNPYGLPTASVARSFHSSVAGV